MGPGDTRNIDPAKAAFHITPDDAGNIQATRAVYIGGDGNMRVTMKNGGVVNFVGVTAGSMYPISIIRVWDTGTSATNIVGLS